MSESESDSPGRAKPSVSTDNWLALAEKKLGRGYTLIVNDTRRIANFFKPGIGYETCSYTAAVKLIKSGKVVRTGDHDLGAMYGIATEDKSAT
jgi:hypothetical protein